ncbi:MAG: response regulator transcription factor [Ignavibacteriales bacterium]|nr:response regulator transcription factor [Ignavibacteriales bacterium]
MKKILIIEDDLAILRGLVDNLNSEHYSVVAESDGIKGFEKARTAQWDLLVLDVMLPGMNGLEICRQLRSAGSKIPILMLTGKGDETDKVLGLELGADDYVTKPFSVRELLARIKALLRRQTDLVSLVHETDIGEVHIDFKRQEASKGKKKIEMSAKEYELLRYFVEREGQVISRDQLLNEVWGYEAMPTTRTVDNYILSLRKKIEPSPSKPRYLLTIHTVGYKFVRP